MIGTYPARDVFQVHARHGMTPSPPVGGIFCRSSTVSLTAAIDPDDRPNLLSGKQLQWLKGWRRFDGSPVSSAIF